MTEYVNEENCTECIHHDIFWEGSGCNLLNNMESCRFKQKDLLDLSLLFASLEEIIDAAERMAERWVWRSTVCNLSP